MTEQDWNFPEGRFLSYVLGPIEPGAPSLYIVLNAAPEAIEFTFPALQPGRPLDSGSSAPRMMRDQGRRDIRRRRQANGACDARFSPLRKRHEHAAQFGPRLHADGVTFRLWAPKAKQVELVTDRAHPMMPRADGWHELTLADARAGTRYKFRIDGELEVPDPASHFQPDDVSGPSEVIDQRTLPVARARLARQAMGEQPFSSSAMSGHSRPTAISAR